MSLPWSLDEQAGEPGGGVREASGCGGRAFNPALAAVCLLLLLLLPASGSADEITSARPGIVVESVQQGFAAERAGLREGDVLLRWERAAAPPGSPAAATGELVSPFDVRDLEIGQASVGPVTIVFERNGVAERTVLPRGRIRLRATPSLPVRWQDEYRLGADHLAAGRPAETARVWRDLAARSRAIGRADVSAWLRHEVGWMWLDEQDGSLAEEAFQRVLEEAESAGLDRVVARALTSLGNVYDEVNELDRSEAVFRQVLGIRLHHAADSLFVANALNELAIVAWSRGLLDLSESRIRASLEIRRRLAPVSFEVAGSLNNLGTVAQERGDLIAAERYFEQALALKQRLAPESYDVASTLLNLGIVAEIRGDLDRADRVYLRALGIYERLDPEDIGVAMCLNNLGIVAEIRGELDEAEGYYRRALALKEKLAPGSAGVASSLHNLGGLAEIRGDLAAAEAHHTRALQIWQQAAPDSVALSHALHGLGVLAFHRGEVAAARSRLEEAVAILERLASRSMEHSIALDSLGQVLDDQGEAGLAEATLLEALSIREEIAPSTGSVGETCYHLAGLHRRTGRAHRALELYARAIDAFEAQAMRLGGGQEARSSFGSLWVHVYREYIELLLEHGHDEAAFLVSERSRARGLLALLANRDLVFAEDIPADLERERRRLRASAERILAELAETAAGDNEERARLRRELLGVRAEESELRRRVRQASPRLAALRDPTPLDLDETMAQLDPGTLVLAYSVGAEKTVLFAIGPGHDDFAASTLAVGEERLRRQVERFRQLARLPDSGEQLEGISGSLGEALLGPAVDSIRQAQRLLVIPDGPLHALPFAALALPGGETGELRYLVEQVPIHTAISVTLFAELKQGRRAREAVLAAAFGDPVYPGGEAPGLDSPRPAVYRDAFPLTAIPATRREVAHLRDLLRDRASAHVGADATEENLRGVGSDVSVVHLACHGLLSHRFPLESALALTIPAEASDPSRDGLLQAWEVFEQIRLDADLVTLSACETGLGREMGGDGLIGLSRAFLFAGARSVLASLWRVSDETTAELMRRFYSNLVTGQPKDQALRNAQLDLIRSPIALPAEGRAEFLDASHPFYWAAFELIGDWK